MELNVAEKSTKSVVILAAPALWKSPWLFCLIKIGKKHTSLSEEERNAEIRKWIEAKML